MRKARNVLSPQQRLVALSIYRRFLKCVPQLPEPAQAKFKDNVRSAYEAVKFSKIQFSSEDIEQLISNSQYDLALVEKIASMPAEHKQVLDKRAYDDKLVMPPAQKT